MLRPDDPSPASGAGTRASRRRRSPAASSIPAAQAEAVFLPADPPRAGLLALWHPDGLPAAPVPAAAPAPDSIEPAPIGSIDLVLPAGASGESFRTRTVPARLVPLADAIAWLVRFEADDRTPASLAAWVTAFRLGVDVVARGRLHPGVTPLGFDSWRAGPLDITDEQRLTRLSDRFPARAHATRVPRSRPLAIPDAATMIRSAWDAIADTLVRTTGADAVGSSPAFAAMSPTDVRPWGDWLESTTHGFRGAGARPVLRLDLPDEDDDPLVAALQLRSHADPSLLVDANDLWNAPAAVLARLGDDAETNLLLALRRGAAVWPPLQRALDQPRPSAVEIDDAEAGELFGSVAADLATAGFEVLWPAALTARPIELRAVVGAPAPAAVGGTGLDLSTLLDFRWQASIGDEPLTEEELHILAEAKRPLVRLRGQWVAADPELMRRLRSGDGTVRASDALAAALAGTLTVAGEEVAVTVDGALASLADRIRSIDHDHEVPEPVGLAASLRPYQRRGLAWLAEMTDLGLGVCLADDMGLGKTIQLIALHLHRHASVDHAAAPANAPTLVVCPTSLLGNWERELHRFAPGVPVRRYHGGDRTLDDLAANEVVLATYGVVRRDREALAATRWGLVVADEAQHAKNPLARTARALRTIPAPARVALTGTPIENRLTELWAILDWTTPGLLGTLDDFRHRVAIPVERHRDPEATAHLTQLVRPFLLRRRKSDPGIAPELPPKTETDVFVPLTAEQATLYEAVVRETLQQIAEADGIARRGLVLKLLTGLKQIANHPAQYLHQDGSLDGRSGKLAALDELLDVIVEAGDSVLVFTQYVEMGRLLEAHLAARGHAPLFLHGGISASRREQLVDRFQAGEVPVLLLSLKAGGTGLNLTRATHVVHYDRWWNPAVEDQATDRAYRIGQDRPVQVHRLITEGTVEEHIVALLGRKRDLADAIVGTGEGWIGELTDDELAALVRLSGDQPTSRVPRGPAEAEPEPEPEPVVLDEPKTETATATDVAIGADGPVVDSVDDAVDDAVDERAYDNVVHLDAFREASSRRGRR